MPSCSPQLLKDLARLHIEAGALFRVAAKYIIHTLSNLLGRLQGRIFQ